MKKLVQVFAIGILLSLGTLAQAQTTHFVNADGECGGNAPCYTSIEAAAIAAAAGDQLQVAPNAADGQTEAGKDLILEKTASGTLVIVSGNDNRGAIAEKKKAIQMDFSGVQTNSVNAPKATAEPSPFY